MGRKQLLIRSEAREKIVHGCVALVDRMVSGTGAYGFDASRSTYVDQIDAGIIDPTKVVRSALENAVSVASVLLLTEATLTEIPEQKAEQPTAAEMMP